MSTLASVTGPGAARLHTLLWSAAAVWCGAILLAPIAGLDSIYAFFSTICHQMTERSWHLGGEPLAVCIRCTAIYFGALAALAVRLALRTWLLRLALGAMGAEFIAARLWIDWEVTRALSGLLLGLAAAGFVERGIREMLDRRRTVPSGRVLENAP